MSDLLTNRLAAERKRLTELLKEQADKIPVIEEFSALAKKMELPKETTEPLDELLKITKAIFSAANVEIPKPEE